MFCKQGSVSIVLCTSTALNPGEPGGLLPSTLGGENRVLPIDQSRGMCAAEYPRVVEPRCIPHLEPWAVSRAGSAPLLADGSITDILGSLWHVCAFGDGCTCSICKKRDPARAVVRPWQLRCVCRDGVTVRGLTHTCVLGPVCWRDVAQDLVGHVQHGVTVPWL
jgi:hypothetical protein